MGRVRAKITRRFLGPVRLCAAGSSLRVIPETGPMGQDASGGALTGRNKVHHQPQRFLSFLVLGQGADTGHVDRLRRLRARADDAAPSLHPPLGHHAPGLPAPLQPAGRLASRPQAGHGSDGAAGERFVLYSPFGVVMRCGRLPWLEFDAVWFAAVSVVNHSLA
jgi:hypothetical protein